MRRLLQLVAVAVALGVAHHTEHIVRGVVGWPLSSEVNPFTISLVVYPVVLLGFELTRRRKVGPAFWAVVTAASLVAVAVIHLTPSGPEPPRSVLDEYESAAAGLAALALVVALVVALAASAVYAVVLWRRGRTSAAMNV